MENFIFCAVNVNINEDKNKDKGNYHSYDDINNDDHDTDTDYSDKWKSNIINKTNNINVILNSNKNKTVTK